MEKIRDFASSAFIDLEKDCRKEDNFRDIIAALFIFAKEAHQLIYQINGCRNKRTMF